MALFKVDVTFRLELLNFTNLEVLILDGSALHIRFLQSIAVLPSVKHLSMRNCYLYGTSDFQGKLKNIFLHISVSTVNYWQHQWALNYLSNNWGKQDRILALMNFLIKLFCQFIMMNESSVLTFSLPFK